MAILTTSQAMEKYQIGSQSTILELFRRKGSPAFLTGKNWKVDDEKFERYLQKESESRKG